MPSGWSNGTNDEVLDKTPIFTISLRHSSIRGWPVHQDELDTDHDGVVIAEYDPRLGHCRRAHCRSRSQWRRRQAVEASVAGGPRAAPNPSHLRLSEIIGYAPTSIISSLEKRQSSSRSFRRNSDISAVSRAAGIARSIRYCSGTGRARVAAGPSTDTPMPHAPRQDTQPESAAEPGLYGRPMLPAMLRDMYPIAGFATHPL